MSQCEIRVWVIVRGAIRLEFELYTTLAWLCQEQSLEKNLWKALIHEYHQNENPAFLRVLRIVFIYN